MKLIFNDATDMPIQSYEKIGGAVRFLTIGIAPEKLKEIFEDATKTKVMNVTERGQIIDTLENYTGYDYTEIHPGGIYGVVNNKAGLSTEERLDDMGIKLETAKQDIEALKENGGNGGAPGTYASVFAMAKISAEKITDDEQALKVADLYDLWSGDGVAYKTGKYITYQDALYKVLQNHTSQADWAPDTASSLYAKVLTDPTGKVLDTTVIYPTQPQNKVEEAKVVLKKLISKYHITLISLGNGTASRESEQIIVDLLKEIPVKVQYIIVNEAGASVYSASKLATEEFPNFDVGQRSATSMARRLQDPLAELVKIDPKSIGVGQYQHDMNQKKLSEALGGVVEDCVNKVGVDLNTASVSLLEYISGISKVIAKNIVAYREENGKFASRSQLLKVAKLGPKAYEQCAGFLRITGGKNPLDATGVHPESYEATRKLLEKLGYSEEEISGGGLTGISKKISDYKKLAAELEVGELTLRDIVKELEKPARDPREDMPKPILRSDVLEMKDLTPGMVLKGTVRNVIDFGAFVDIGVHQDGLVHVSQMSERYIKHPLEVVSVGDIVEVKVMSVDLKKQRIQLTMKL